MMSATRTPSARPVLFAAVVAASFALTGTAFAAGLPDYPAAKARAISAGVRSMTSRCGHTFTIEKSLDTDADPRAVAKWYQSRLPGSRTIDESRLEDDEAGAGQRQTTIGLYTADGSQIVIISRTQYTGALAASAKTLGMDKTRIGVEAISPPIAPSFIDRSAQIAAGGASAERAKQQMKAECKG